jgi:hypothetical protein
MPGETNLMTLATLFRWSTTSVKQEENALLIKLIWLKVTLPQSLRPRLHSHIPSLSTTHFSTRVTTLHWPQFTFASPCHYFGLRLRGPPCSAKWRLWYNLPPHVVNISGSSASVSLCCPYYLSLLLTCLESERGLDKLGIMETFLIFFYFFSNLFLPQIPR